MFSHFKCLLATVIGHVIKLMAHVVNNGYELHRGVMLLAFLWTYILQIVRLSPSFSLDLS